MAKTAEIQYMTMAEFRSLGFLLEANRQFFHPLGLALGMQVDEDGNDTSLVIWDYRCDPEGIRYAEFTEEDIHKAQRIEDLQKQKAKIRQQLLGYIVQPLNQE